MAGSGAPVRQLRRGPAPIASFDHDGSDEVRPSSPENKQAFRLPEIREDPVCSTSLAPPEQRARSHSSPAVTVAAVAALGAPAAPRIDISRASSSSHHDSRDSSPELALFTGGGSEDARGRLELGFREDGALELRSSTEELAFLEGAPGEPRPAAPPPPSISRRHSRKDSQGSEAALLAVSGRTSRLSSVGSQCSAHSAISAFSHASRVSGRLSVVSGVSRSPSPHRMLLETSFCGPKPIETDPEICAAAVEERLLEIAKLTTSSPPSGIPPAPVDARDRREVRTEATVERASRPPPPSPQPVPAPSPVVTTAAPAPEPTPIVSSPVVVTPAVPDDDKLQKETQNRARAQERRARPRVRREPSEQEVYKSGNRTKDIIRIKLKPDDEYEETMEETPQSSQQVTVDTCDEAARKPASLELEVPSERAVRPTELVGRAEPAPLSPSSRGRAPRDSRTPSPAGVPVSRKSSFCSLFKSRETIASPDSPSDALRRKRSLTEGRSRSKSRDRSATPSSAGKIRGSVMSLFRTPRKSGASPSPSSREGSPVVQPQRAITPALQPTVGQRRGEKLKYYEDSRDGIIHIPLRTPPDERPGSSGARREPEPERGTTDVTTHHEAPRPASAPHNRAPPERESATSTTEKPVHRTVLPDGSIIIPLRSPTERVPDDRPPSLPNSRVATPATSKPIETEHERRSPSVASAGAVSATSGRPIDCTPEAAPNMEQVEHAPSVEDTRRRRKERIIFTTHVGSREQVFSTQFSITKTPSVTSEISGSFPSFMDPEEPRGSAPRDMLSGDRSPTGLLAGGSDTCTATPCSPEVRDSSESEPSSESAPPRGGNDVERRGLVVQESFEEELPYVPTTLPQERSVALPMVPVRERGGVLVTGVERPRSAMPAPPPPIPAALAPRVTRPAPAPVLHPAVAPTPPDRLRIRLPRRPRTASVASVTTVPTPRTDRVRTRSGGDESRAKTEWIDFSEVPERRKQPKRIQTLPAAAASGAGASVVFSYVEPEHCRCECHASAPASTPPAASDDELPLLHDDPRAGPSTACGADEAGLQLNAPTARPFTADLDLHPDGLNDEERRPH